MGGICAFWLLFWVPGALLLWRTWPEAFRGGIPVWLPAAFFASLLLLTPMTVVGYAFELPLWWLSGSVVLLVGGSLLALAYRPLREPALRALRPRVSPLPLCAAMVCTVDLYLSARSGSHLYGDGGYHIARVRSLLDEGFSAASPLWPGRVEHVYVANLYHAVVAVSAQLSGTPPTTAFAYMFPVVKLWNAGGCAAFAYAATRSANAAVVGRAHAPWVVLATAMVYWGPQSMLAYPNTVAPLFGMGMTCALWCTALGCSPALKWLLACAAAVLLTAQIHPLYAVFLVLLLAPVTLVWALMRGLRRDGRRARYGLLLLAALTLGVPHAALGRLVQDPPTEQVTVSHPFRRGSVGQVRDQSAATPSQGILKALPEGRWAASLGRYIRWDRPFAYALGGLLWLSLSVPAARVAALIAGALMAALHVPLVCSFLVGQAGAPWIVARLSIVYDLLSLALAPALLVLVVRWAIERVAGFGPRLREAFSLAPLLAGLAYGHWVGVDHPVWPRAAYLERLFSPGPLPEQLAELSVRRQLLRRHVPAGAVVVAHPRDDYQLVMLHSVFPLAVHPLRGNRHVRDMAERRADALALLRGRLSNRQVSSLLRHYGTRYLWVRSGRHGLWLCKRYRSLCQGGFVGGRRGLVEFSPDRGAPLQ